MTTLVVDQMHKEQGEPARERMYASYVTDFGESSCLKNKSQIEMTCPFGPCSPRERKVLATEKVKACAPCLVRVSDTQLGVCVLA